ncbi:RNA polymerase sigma factor [Haliangium sp.]|uniref:RNA polymerase sigma factor n=1 Tax=Haliangium sp. TaxID=2663208 RepID=UPI003D11976B
MLCSCDLSGGLGHYGLVMVIDPAMSSAAPEDDVRLAAACADGDREAQRTLFRTYRDRVHATLYRIMGSNRDMEDLVQDVFLQVYRSIHSYRGDARLGTWISRITTRVAFAYLSRRGPGTVTLEAVPDPVAATPSAERQAVAREAMRRLYGVLERIETKQRIAFSLHAIDGRSIREVAEMTGASVTATKTRIWRARKEIDKRAGKDPLLASFLKKENGA